MKAFDYQKAIELGYSPEEIDSFLKENPVQVVNKQEQPQPNLAPTPAPPQDHTSLLGGSPPQTPDVVSPFNTTNYQKTQDIGDTYTDPTGHKGEDYAIYDNPQVNAPIGGSLVRGTAPGRGYGNWSAVIGANPQELDQMDPAQLAQMQQDITNTVNAGGDLSQIPSLLGKNVTLSAHGENNVGNTGDRIATGSALMDQGGSGGWAPHLHQQIIDTNGNQVPLSEMIDMHKLLGNTPAEPPPTDFNQIVQQQIKKRLKK